MFCAFKVMPMYFFTFVVALWTVGTCTAVDSNENARSTDFSELPIIPDSTASKYADFAVIAYLPEWRYEGGFAGLDRFPSAHILHSAHQASEKHGCKLLLCFGGNGRSSGFATMVKSKKATVKFVKKLGKFLKKYNFHGVDYNWEYPGYVMGKGYADEKQTKQEYDGFLSLVQKTREHLPADTVITLAYYPDKKQENMLKLRGFDNMVDYLHMMTYDQQTGTNHLTHSTLEFAQASVQQGLQSGLTASRLTMGVPFYGRHSRTGDWTTYEDLVQQYHPLARSADIAVVAVGKGDGNKAKPDAYIGFNGIETMETKVRYALESGIGGIMIWEVGQDCRVIPTVRIGQTHGVTCPEGKNSSLLEAITRTVRRYRHELLTSEATPTLTIATDTGSARAKDSSDEL